MPMMIKKHKNLFLLGLFLIGLNSINAQEETTINGLETTQKKMVYQLRAGVNIGGFSPVPIPEEIREIEGFNPKLNFNIAGNATYWFFNSNAAWGIRAGIRLENKGMSAKSKVKNYGMEIIGDDGNRVAGNWTGRVSTEVANSYLSFPITAVYKLSKPWEISAGFIVSYLMDKDFSGYVSDGYLREGGPTGEKAIFEGESKASYDFSDNLSRFSYGIQVGGSLQVYSHLRVFADLSYGFNDIFKSDFETITFKMHPIYLNFGFAYVFK